MILVFGVVSLFPRGVFAGGTGPATYNVIQYITIASTGNAIDFGDLLSQDYGVAGSGSSTRGIINSGSAGNVIQYITIASTGNSIDFGDLTNQSSYGSATSNATRSVLTINNNTNIINYVTIASTGNATDFGDLLANANSSPSGCSNANGGL